MGFGFAVSFIIFLVIAVVLSYFTHNIWNGIVLIAIYAIVKMSWRILRK